MPLRPRGRPSSADAHCCGPCRTCARTIRHRSCSRRARPTGARCATRAAQLSCGGPPDGDALQFCGACMANREGRRHGGAPPDAGWALQHASDVLRASRRGDRRGGGAAGWWRSARTVGDALQFYGACVATRRGRRHGGAPPGGVGHGIV
jgi:hypothetical protein